MYNETNVVLKYGLAQFSMALNVNKHLRVFHIPEWENFPNLELISNYIS